MHIDEWLAGLAKEEQEKQAAAELEGLFDHMSVEDVLQIAGSDQEKVAEEAKHDVKPSWWAGQKAQARAMRAGDKGAKKYVADSELVGKRLKGMAGGGAVGAGIGTLAGHLSGKPGGKALGALVGGLAGGGIGVGRAEKQYLKGKGIKQRMGGLASPHMTQEAAKKYLKEHEGRKKVAFVTKIARQIAHEHAEVEKQAVIGGALLVGGAGALYGKAKDKKVGKSAAKGALIGGAAEGAGYLGALAGRALTAGERASLRGGAGLAGGIGGALVGGLAMRRAVKDKKKDKEMTKEDAFTTPEAKAKAKVMSRAMKATKGAPPNVMRSAIKMTAKQVRAVDR